MSALHWFEIAVQDLNRAQKFYETILATQIHVMDMREQMGSRLGLLPDRDGIGGALVENAQHGYVPATTGTLVYLVVDGDLNDTLGKIAGAGGQVMLPKTPLGDGQGDGYIAWVGDTEGNKIGLFSKA